MASSALTLIETMTGRVLRTLPHSSVDWRSPLGGIPELTVATATDDVLDALASSDPVTGVRVRRPRELLRTVLSGTWRLGLVASWDGRPLVGGPLVGADPPDGGKITLKAQGMERMLERRETWRWDGTGGITHVSRDVVINNATPRTAIRSLVDHAMTGPAGALPIIHGPVAPPPGSETMTWPSWDVRDIWSAIRALITRPDGPDIRLDPMPARETADGMVIDWLLEIGDPLLETPTQRDAGGVEHPPTFPRVLVPPVPSVERGRFTTHQWAFGDGQDRLRTVARASADHLLAAGMPRLSTFDTGGSQETPAATQGRANAVLAATSVPMTGAWSASTTLDDVDLATVRRGNLARLHVANAVVVDDGVYDRRISKIEGKGRELSLTFDEDPDST